MKPLRICLVSKEYPPEGKGGIGTYTRLLAHGLAQREHNVTVLTAAKGNNRSAFPHENSARTLPEQAGGGKSLNAPLITAQDPSALTVFRVENNRFPLPEFAKRRPRGLWDELERSKAVDRAIQCLERTSGPFDVIEMPNTGPEAFFYSLHPRAAFVIRLSTPMSLTNHLKDRPSKKLGFRLHCLFETHTVRRADAYIAHSSFIALQCARLYGIPFDGIRVIPLGTPLAPLLPPQKKKKSARAVRILYVGRLQKRKGIQLLLQAIQIVAEKMPNVEFQIAGLDAGDAPRLPGAPVRDTTRATYKRYFASIATQQAQDATIFLGHVEEKDLARLYSGCDILVAPSLFESFGLMYAEAMAHAKPVVAFHTGAAPEVVAHNQTGLLVEPNNVTELARALIELAGDPQRIRDMGLKGYQRIRAEFSVERMVSATEAHYRQVIEERNRA